MSQPQSEEERVRSYLIAQAAKLPLPDLIEKVRNDTLPLKTAASIVPLSRFTERPGEADWSAAEVWTHILEMNEHGAAAIPAIIARGEIPPRADDVISGQVRAGLSTGTDYHAAYLSRREGLLAAVSEARGDEHLDVHIHHSMFGDLNWREWLLFMRVHDLDHLRQLQSIAAAFNS